jgi:hypothetical protein
MIGRIIVNGTLAAGRVAAANGRRIFVPPVGIRSDAEVAAQEMECAVCKFNVCWICEHSGCFICSGKQRYNGGLKIYIRRTDFKCPKT